MDICNAANLLETNRIKKTNSRLAVLKEIISKPCPFTVNELFNNVSAAIAIDLATVYRIINLLVKKKILRQVANTEDFQYFELACEHHPEHAHFFCLQCRKINCLENLDTQNLGLFNQYGDEFLINTIAINLTGTCKDCLRQRRKKN